MAWAQDLPDTGVTVHRLSPDGLVYTDFVLPAVRSRAAETRKYFPAEVIVPAAIWLASEQSNNLMGCRDVGSKWQDDLPPAAAAEAAREPAIFLPPKRDSVLTMPWEVPTT